MNSLEQPLYVEVLSRERSDEGLFRLLDDFTFDLSEFGSSGVIVCPKDYVTDFASIPRPFRWYFSTSGKVAKPALLHDIMCRLVDKRATAVFNNTLKASGVRWWKRWPMVAFVFVAKFPDFYL